MTKFTEMGLPESLLHTLTHMQFTTATPIQEDAIPHALAKRDILGTAETGTGKTGAYGIPLVAGLQNNIGNNMALVITPTRELASQVIVQLRAMLGKNSKIKSALLIGGDSISKQLSQLRNKPNLIVGTPGRINDHLKRKSLNLANTNYLVLDETDRMLDMGFKIQIEEILKFVSDDRQTLLFSATMPKNIVNISKKYLNNPVHISIASDSPFENITQEMIKVNDKDKYENLLSQLGNRDGSVIIFAKTKFSTERLAKRLYADGYDAKAIHGDLKQNKRERVLSSFRAKQYRILVATDIAARGLDIPHIEHVINYDLPQCSEDYIHRIGRTARAGATGSALSIVSPSDMKKWKLIDNMINPGNDNNDHSNEGRKKHSQRRSKSSKANSYNDGNKRARNKKKSSGRKNTDNDFLHDNSSVKKSSNYKKKNNNFSEKNSENRNISNENFDDKKSTRNQTEKKRADNKPSYKKRSKQNNSEKSFAPKGDQTKRNSTSNSFEGKKSFKKRSETGRKTRNDKRNSSINRKKNNGKKNKIAFKAA